MVSLDLFGKTNGLTLFCGLHLLLILGAVRLPLSLQASGRDPRRASLKLRPFDVKKLTRGLLAHRSDMDQMVVLPSLGFLAVWTIGPFAFFIVISFHHSADSLGSMLPLSEPNKRGSTPEKVERDARRPSRRCWHRRNVDGRNLPTTIGPSAFTKLAFGSPVTIFRTATRT